MSLFQGPVSFPPVLRIAPFLIAILLDVTTMYAVAGGPPDGRELQSEMEAGMRLEALEKAPNLIVTTYTKVIGGMPGMESPPVSAGYEFALAPVQNGTPLFAGAIVATSMQDGSFAIALPAGRYWIGPVEKLAKQGTHSTASIVIQEQLFEISADKELRMDLLRIGYAP